MTTSHKDKKKYVNKSSKYILTRMIEDDNSRYKVVKKVVNLEKRFTQPQDGFWHSLTHIPTHNIYIKHGHDFLLKHGSSKVSLVIIYVDLVGSTKMSMKLPADKLVTLIRAFSHQISFVVKSYEGYVLKYVGDAVIAFFPSDFNRHLTYDKAVLCAKSMITAIKEKINPVLSKHDYPELKLKIGMDEGENVVVQYGYNRNSQIDILGYTMNVTSKITSLTGSNSLSVGHNMYKLLNPKIQSEFQELSNLDKDWKYLDSETGQIYKVYTLKQSL